MKKVKNNWKKILIVAVLLTIVVGILIIATNFKKDPTIGKINIVINNNNVTAKLKQDIFIDNNGVIYVSKDDIANYFDGQVYYDKENEQLITTSETKVAVLSTTEKTMKVNGAEVRLLGTVVRKDGVIYIPISELGNVYNIDIQNINNSVIIIDSMNRSLIKADTTKKVKIKSSMKLISKTVDKVDAGEKLVIVSEKDNWTRVRTSNGKLGYVKTDVLTNKTQVRQEIVKQSQINGKVNLVWDYYSEYASAPNRTGTTIPSVNVVSPSFFSLKNNEEVEINDNAKRGGKEYIDWAKENGYKVWAMFSNNSMKETTSKILNDYKKREKMIEKIVDLALQYRVDGINVDFENMNMSDKDVYSRFIIELAPRLREYGIVTSVDVTAPDGSETWSLCFDRDLLANRADYLCFMAYDQYGISSTTPGTTAGADWVEANIKKFLGQEDVKKEKIILGIPLYTRLWKTDSTGKSTSTVVNMNKVSEKIPNNVTKTWDEDLKQNYIEYEDKGYKYQMWIEDEQSIKEKLNLINVYDLAGACFWEIDRENDEIWTIAQETLETK